MAAWVHGKYCQITLKMWANACIWQGVFRISFASCSIRTREVRTQAHWEQPSQHLWHCSDSAHVFCFIKQVVKRKWLVFYKEFVSQMRTMALSSAATGSYGPTKKAELVTPMKLQWRAKFRNEAQKTKANKQKSIMQTWLSTWCIPVGQGG